MTVDLSKIRALTFDVGGTVFDWHSTIHDEVAALGASTGRPVDPHQFAIDWRTKMFELLAKVRGGDLPWMNADQLHRLALDEIAPNQPSFQLSAAERDDLNRVWHRLRTWPDFPPVLEQLRTRYTVAVLTVLSWSLVVDSSKHGGLSWDGVLSCEFLGHYKPDQAAYLAGLKVIGVEPHEAMMVAAHPWDLRSAKQAGLHTAYVPRPLERGETNPGAGDPMPEFDINAKDFPDLARQLL